MKLLKRNIKIKAVKDTAIAAEGKLFSYIDSNFINWGLKFSGKTKAINASVYEMDKNGTFEELFTSLSSNLDSLVMSQGQIIEFVKTHKGELQDGSRSNFFLMKIKDEFFVAYVFLYSGGDLKVYVRRFSDGHVWNAEYSHCMVVKQSESYTRSSSDPLAPLALKQKIIKKYGTKDGGRSSMKQQMTAESYRRDWKKKRDELSEVVEKHYATLFDIAKDFQGLGAFRVETPFGNFTFEPDYTFTHEWEDGDLIKK